MTETAAAASAQMRIWKATGNFIGIVTVHPSRIHRKAKKHPVRQSGVCGIRLRNTALPDRRILRAPHPLCGCHVSVFRLDRFFRGKHFGNAADHPRRKALRRPFLSGRVCRHRSGTVLCQSAENHLRPRKNCYFPFPRRTQTLLRRDIRQLECTSGSQGLRTLTLHTDNRRYVIREKQFRVGFPEFFNELIH